MGSPRHSGQDVDLAQTLSMDVNGQVIAEFVLCVAWRLSSTRRRRSSPGTVWSYCLMCSVIEVERFRQPVRSLSFGFCSQFSVLSYVQIKLRIAEWMSRAERAAW
jgi:hypothetical protein